jgi:hypothetical protein
LIHFCRSPRLSANSCHDAEDVFHAFLEFGFVLGQLIFEPGKNRLLLWGRFKLLKLGDRFAVYGKKSPTPTKSIQ